MAVTVQRLKEGVDLPGLLRARAADPLSGTPGSRKKKGDTEEILAMADRIEATDGCQIGEWDFTLNFYLDDPNGERVGHVSLGSIDPVAVEGFESVIRAIDPANVTFVSVRTPGTRSW
jgi:hypothetical protein